MLNWSVPGATVDDFAPLEARLSGLSRAALTALLERRPDVLLAVAPRSIHQLAARLWNRLELSLALREVALPHLQLLEAALALGSGVTIDDLTALLDGGQRVVVEQLVDCLDERAVLLRDGETVIVPSALYGIFPSPLGLGTPLVLLLDDRSVDSMREVQAALGLPRTGKRADTVAALVEWFRDADAVRALISQAPANVREYLAQLLDPRDEPGYDSARYDSARYRRRSDAERWAAGHGLVVPSYYSYAMAVPAEVTRALRGPAYRAPFTPQPPAVPAYPVDAQRLARDGAAAAGQFVAQLLTVLDAVAQAPLTALKSGGVGARELARLVRTTGVDEAQVRLVLELARELDLLDTASTGAVAVGARYAAWRAGEPVDQFVAAVTAWWRVDATLTETHTDDGKPIAPLAVPRGCGGCRAARHALAETLDTLAAAGPDERRADADAVAASRADVARLALWRRPLVHIAADDAADPLATPWREAQTLGVIADDALTPLGRALVHGADVPAVTAIAAALLPAATDRATFGTDLTVYVLGTPSARVSALLDSCADREGRGTATTWRLHPASVRRALDAGVGSGVDAAVLLDELAAIATGELPQPLRYLINDVARRHGHLRVGTAACVITGEDPALLAQVAADRRLRKIGARVVAPTVLACDVALPVAMAALRDAGYFPLPADTADAVQTGGSAAPAPVASPPRRGSARPHRPAGRSALEPATVAAALTSVSARTAAPGATERDLLASGAVLTDFELQLLAATIDRPDRVGIDYSSTAGARRRRVVDEPRLDGPMLIGWCELRNDERTFTVSRIIGVFPA